VPQNGAIKISESKLSKSNPRKSKPRKSHEISNMINQRTVNMQIKATGVGVHRGETVIISLRPAPVNTGIVFRRTDISPAVTFAANFKNIGDTKMCTCLRHQETQLATVEHLLSACAGLGVDNLYVDVNAPEIPIMDGSAAPFIFLLQSAGILEQNAPKKFLKIKKTVRVDQGDKWVEIKPYNGFRINYELDYDHPAFNHENQLATLEFSSTAFVKEVSRARTFGFVKDYEFLRKNSLALGASMDNTIALDQFKVINQDGLRYKDEFAKHKILDVVGDLYLLGHPVLGEFSGYKSGHELNSLLLKAIMAEAAAFETVTFEKEKESPFTFMPATSSFADSA
jgi:UDP-3-O-[3-hydroxymyristoyl] N-acetylglucosamine deacetylase